MLPRNLPLTPDPVEFSVEDAMRNAWLEETGDYLQLDTPERAPSPDTEEVPNERS